jgi:hypothetical protein
VTIDGDQDPDQDPADLEPGETILASLHATYSNHAIGNVDALRSPTPTDDGMATFGRAFGRSPRRRRVTGIGRYLQWQEGARAAGFPVAGMAMHLQLTDRRLRVFSASFVRGHARGYAGSVALSQIAQVTVRRAVFGTRLILLMRDGQLISVESGSARKARRFAAALAAALDRRARPSSR